jgi:hypothetical protein
VPAALFEVLAELDTLVTFGPTSPETAAAVGLGKFDQRTATGKLFSAVAEQLGLPDAQLLRAMELPESYRVLDVDAPHIIVRTDLLQLLAPAEMNALFALMLEQARPGARVLCSLPEGEDQKLVRALLATADLMPAGDGAAFEAAIRAHVDEPRLANWRARLGELKPLVAAGVDLPALVRAEIVETSRRVALTATADLRFAAKLLTRLDPSLPKMPSAGKLDDMEEFLGAAPLSGLAGFAASPRFGALVAG